MEKHDQVQMVRLTLFPPDLLESFWFAKKIFSAPDLKLVANLTYFPILNLTYDWF